MSEAVNKLSGARGAAFGLGRAVSLGECFLAALFFPYAFSLGLPWYAIALTVFFGAALPLIAVPYLYDLLNGLNLISTGRYHFTLAVATLSLAFFNALLFSINPLWHPAAMIVTLFFCSVLVALSLIIYLYVYSGIEARLSVKSAAPVCLSSAAFAFYGAAAFAVLFGFLFWIYGLPYPDMGYIVSSAVLLFGFCAYISSYSYMPFLIKGEPSKRRGLKQKYTRFFGPVFVRGNVRALVGLFLFSVSFFSLLFILTDSLCVFGFNAPLTSVLFVALLAPCAASFFLLRNFAVGRPLTALTAGVLAQGLFAAAVIVCAVISPPFAVSAPLLYASAAAFGTGGGLIIRAAEEEHAKMLSNSGTTRGALYVLIVMLVFAAFAVSFFIISLCYAFINVRIMAAAAASLAFLAAASIVYLAKKRYLTLEFPLEDENAESGEDAGGEENSAEVILGDAERIEG